MSSEKSLTPLEQRIWDHYPDDQKRVEADGSRTVLVEHDPFSELVPWKLDEFAKSIERENEVRERTGLKQLFVD